MTSEGYCRGREGYKMRGVGRVRVRRGGVEEGRGGVEEGRGGVEEG